MTAYSPREAARLATVLRYAILDTAPEALFDRVARLAAHAFQAPWAAITIVDDQRVWFKAQIGQNVSQMARPYSLCGHIVATGRSLQLEDAPRDAPPGVIPPPGVRFYVGAPLLGDDGACIGTLCVMDRVPRPPLTDDERELLSDLAAMVMTEMNRRLQQLLQEAATRRLALVNDILGEVGGADGFVAAIEAAIAHLCRYTGADYGHLWDLTPGGAVRLAGFASAHPVDPQIRAYTVAAFNDFADRSDLAFLFERDGPYIAPDVTEESVAHLPLLHASYEHGMRSFVVRQLAVGARCYGLILKFETPRDDLADVADLMGEIGHAIRAALQQKQAEDRLALLNEVLARTGSAEGFVAAVESLAGLLCQKLDALFGMLWARSADGQSIRLVGMGAAAHLSPRWKAAAASAFPIPSRGSLLAQLLDRDGRILMPALAPDQIERAPLLAFGHQHGLRSLAAQSLAVGESRYLLLFGFATPRQDLVQIADLLVEVGQAIRPALQRKQAEDRLALMNEVLACTGSAASFTAAVEGTLGLLCARLDSLFGMLWTRQGNDNNIHLSGLSMGPGDPDEFRSRADAQFPFPANRSLLAGLFDREGRMVVAELDDSITAKFPLSAVGHRYGVRSFVAQSLAVGQSRYVMLLAFATPRHDLEQAADLMAEIGQAIRPVLQRKHTQEQLALLQAAVDATADAVAISDASSTVSGECRLLYANPAFVSMTGYSAEAMIGQGIDFLRGRGTDPSAIRTLDESAQLARPARVELLNYRRDGTPFWADVTTTPIADEHGKITHWVGVTRDTTERHAHQEALQRLTDALRERTAELTEVARMARIGSWRWRVADRVLEWSAEMHDLLGVSPGSLPAAAEAFFDWIHPDDRAAVREGGSRSIAAGADLLLEARVLVPGHLPRVTIWNGHAERDASGAVVALRGYCQDVTERREAEAALRHGEKLRTLGQLTGGIAHDFNNLLTVILANLDMSLDGAGDLAKCRPGLEDARRAALAATDLTRRLLSFARAEPLRFEPTDLNRWLQPLREMAQRILGGRYCVSLCAEPSLPQCAVDKSQLEAAVLNLLLNARDAMPRGGPIELLTETMDVPPGARGGLADLLPGRYAVVAVRDCGSGMPPEVVGRVFEPFFTTKPSGSGSGLGLSMVLSFARRSGGTVVLDTAAGRGTTVRILLPL